MRNISLHIAKSRYSGLCECERERLGLAKRWGDFFSIFDVDIQMYVLYMLIAIA